GVAAGTSPAAALACVVVAMAACALLGVVIERFAYRPVRNAPKLTPLVTAIGVSMLLQNVAVLAFSATPRAFPGVIRATTVRPGLKAFVAAVLGGIGNIPGAMVGGLLVGVVEQLAAAYLSSSFAPAIVFAILVLVLLFRPQGLLGRVAREKV